MKPILIIHEFEERFFDLPLDQYTLTFDDGLYTQYVFLEELKNIKTKKYFFISSGIVCPENIEQNGEYIICNEAHKKAFNGDYTNYMKWSQIKEIDESDDCYIGCHSHFHNIKTADCVECMIPDNRYMLHDFKQKLGYIPDIFCFPYNYETPLYREILNKKGFKNFYGKDRVDIFDL
tara:strand:- start:772 stop:1302 length:531 start_codon:yes stop_codon:yes gene_type:complete